MLLTFTPTDNKEVHIAQVQHCPSWPGDARRLSIRSQCIDLVFLEYPIFHTRRVKYPRNRMACAHWLRLLIGTLWEILDDDRTNHRTTGTTTIRVGVTKTPLVKFCVRDISEFAEIPALSIGPHSYLIGGTTPSWTWRSRAHQCLITSKNGKIKYEIC